MPTTLPTELVCAGAAVLALLLAAAWSKAKGAVFVAAVAGAVLAVVMGIGAPDATPGSAPAPVVHVSR